MRLLMYWWWLLPLGLGAQTAQIDSLRRVIETTKVDTVRARTLCRLCSAWVLAGQYAHADSVGRTGSRLAHKAKDWDGLAACLNNLGISYENQGKNDSAMYFYNKSIQFKLKSGNSLGIAATLINLSNIQADQGLLPAAVKNLLKALRYYTQVNHPYGQALVYGNLANISERQNNLQQALSYNQKSFDLYSQLNDSVGQSICLVNMGRVYLSLGQHQQALSCFHQDLNLIDSVTQMPARAHSLLNLGLAYQSIHDNAQARAFFRHSLSLFKQMNDQPGVVGALGNLAKVHFQEGKIAAAQADASRGLELALRLGLVSSIENLANISYQIDSARGDWKSAFAHHRLFKLYSDSLKNDEQSKELGRLESKFEFEQQAEAEKREAETAARLEAERTERRNNLQYLSIFAGLIGLFGGLVLLRRLRVPVRSMEVALFAGLLILFEFLLVLFDPVVDDYSGGVPYYKLAFNTLIAVVLAPLHRLGQRGLRQRLIDAAPVQHPTPETPPPPPAHEQEKHP